MMILVRSIAAKDAIPRKEISSCLTIKIQDEVLLYLLRQHRGRGMFPSIKSVLMNEVSGCED